MGEWERRRVLETRTKGGWNREDGRGRQEQVGGEVDGLRGEQTNENWEEQNQHVTHRAPGPIRPKFCQKALKIESKDPLSHS